MLIIYYIRRSFIVLDPTMFRSHFGWSVVHKKLYKVVIFIQLKLSVYLYFIDGMGIGRFNSCFKLKTSTIYGDLSFFVSKGQDLNAFGRTLSQSKNVCIKRIKFPLLLFIQFAKKIRHLLALNSTRINKKQTLLLIQFSKRIIITLFY